jgi:hypothetical protein
MRERLSLDKAFMRIGTVQLRVGSLIVVPTGPERPLLP